MFGFVQLVIDHDGTVRQFSYPRSLANSAASVRKILQQFDVVQQGIAEALGGIGIIFGDIADDLGQVAQRFLREEEAEIHLGNNPRTCSTGTVRPVRASRRPSSMASRVARSSFSTEAAAFSDSDVLALAMSTILTPACRKHNSTPSCARRKSWCRRARPVARPRQRGLRATLDRQQDSAQSWNLFPFFLLLSFSKRQYSKDQCPNARTSRKS